MICIYYNEQRSFLQVSAQDRFPKQKDTYIFVFGLERDAKKGYDILNDFMKEDADARSRLVQRNAFDAG